MSYGISNFEIERVFKEINNPDINKNFLGAFPFDKINKFIMFEKMMPEKMYPLMISNTDRSDEIGPYWWGILNILPKRFIVTDDKKTVGKVLKGLEAENKKDDKLTLIKLKFPMAGYKNLTKKEISGLFSVARDFFHLIHSFGMNEKITNFVNVWMLEDPIQIATTSTCGPFQLYFYENLFFPDENSKLQNCKKLTNVALKTIINQRTFCIGQRK